jgi:hypothetical protein
VIRTDAEGLAVGRSGLLSERGARCGVRYALASLNSEHEIDERTPSPHWAELGLDEASVGRNLLA